MPLVGSRRGLLRIRADTGWQILDARLLGLRVTQGTSLEGNLCETANGEWNSRSSECWKLSPSSEPELLRRDIDA
jgi:hypothetical protein